MKPATLRSWIRRYGAIGYLLVGVYLGLHHLWTWRRTALLAIAAVIVCIAPILRLVLPHKRGEAGRQFPILSRWSLPPSVMQAGIHSKPLGVLAYVRNSDIYVQALPDGAKQRLTHDGHNSDPQWSPTGKWLAFLKDSSLWVMRRDGTQARFVSYCPGWPAWSPVSDLLAYHHEGGLRLLQPGTWRQRALTASSEYAYGDEAVAWSPDGRWLAYNREDRQMLGEGYEMYEAHINTLWRICSDGSRAKRIYRSVGKDEADYPVQMRWSPDGKRILFWREVDDSASLNADGAPFLDVSSLGGEPRLLTGTGNHSPTVLYQNLVLQRDDYVDFSPDGKQVAIVQGGGRCAIENKRIVSLNYTSGKGKYLTGQELACTCPSWSPDGNQIAYISAPAFDPDNASVDWTDRLRRCRLSIMDADGMHQRPLTTGMIYQDDLPRWLADGKHILFARYAEGCNDALWISDIDGKEARQVAEVGSANCDETERLFDVWIPVHAGKSLGRIYHRRRA